MLTAETMYSRRYADDFERTSKDWIRSKVINAVLNDTMIDGSAFNKSVRNIKADPSIMEIINCCHSFNHVFSMIYSGAHMQVDVDGFNSSFCFITAVSPAEYEHSIDKLIRYSHLGMKAFLALEATGCDECYLVHIQHISKMTVRLYKFTKEQIISGKIKVDTYLYKNDIKNEELKHARDRVTSNFTLLPHFMEVRSLGNEPQYPYK